jgi:hypothetical protein
MERIQALDIPDLAERLNSKGLNNLKAHAPIIYETSNALNNSNNNQNKIEYDYTLEELKKMSYSELGLTNKLEYVKKTYPKLFEAKRMVAYPLHQNGNILDREILEFVYLDLMKMTFGEIEYNKLLDITISNYTTLYKAKKFIAYPFNNFDIKANEVKELVIIDLLNYDWVTLEQMGLLDIISKELPQLHTAKNLIQFPNKFNQHTNLDVLVKTYILYCVMKLNYSELDHAGLIEMLIGISPDFVETKKLLFYSNLGQIKANRWAEIDFMSKSWDELDKSSKLPLLKKLFPALYESKYNIKFNKF